MKSYPICFSRRAQIVRLSPLLLCLSAHAAVVPLNESNSTHDWTLPSGINLLNGATAHTPSAPQHPDHGNGDVASSSWLTLTDGTLGAAGNKAASVTPDNGHSVIFPLDTTINSNGYNLTSFDSYCAWPDSGRDNQDFTIEYSTVGDPATFIPIATVSNHTGAPNNSTHTRLTDDTGFLATGVHSVRFVFANQENGYTGYREFILFGTAVPLADPLTWTGAGGSAGSADWTVDPDNNWKLTADGTPSDFSSLSALTFDSTGTNTDINVPVALTASAMIFTNDVTTPYTFGGDLLTVSNNLVSSGTGSVTFDAPTSFATGVDMSGTGSLVFNGTLQSTGLLLSGTGSVTLGTDNNLAGVTSVADGTLNVSSDFALGLSALTVSGGTVNFTSAFPVVGSLAGSGGSVVLGSLPSGDTSLQVGNPDITAYAGSITDASPTANGSITKVDSGTLTLSGTNTYTGTTAVAAGQLEFGKRVSLYNATPASWTSSKITVESGAVLGFRVGGPEEFTESDLAALDPAIFGFGSVLGLNTTGGDFTLAHAFGGDMGILKSGNNVLRLTGANTYTGPTKVIRGVLEAASPSAASIPGDAILGDASAPGIFLNLGADNQFAPTSVVSFQNGPAANAKLQLRGTSQTIEGLDGAAAHLVSIVQNDELGTPGFISATPGDAVLTINATSDHSFKGLIRNGDGVTSPLAIVKTGPGVQEFVNTPVQGYSYSGPTTIDEGTLRLNFANNAPNGFGSNVTVNSPGGVPAIFALDGNFDFGMTISGTGRVEKQGAGTVRLVNSVNQYSGGTTVTAGILALSSNGGAGAGTGPGQFCTAGEMIPSNVVTVENGATLRLDGVAPLGNSEMLPEFGLSILINPGAKLSGGINTVAFVPNLTLNGGVVDITDGAGHGGFNTNLALVGTVVVGGSSTLQSVISTSGVGANANVSLGSLGLPGTVFQVANVTGNGNTDLGVSSVLGDVHGTPSPLTKTGPGTMFLQAVNTYTGTTHVMEGELRLDSSFLADDSAVIIDAAGTLNLLHSDEDVVGTLTLEGTPVSPGSYVAVGNTTPGAIQTPRIKGDGILVVTSEPLPGFDQWAEIIPNADDRERSDDPDGDGFDNLSEYLFGTSPNQGNGSLTTTERTPAGLVIRWNEIATGAASYVLQESATLEAVSWLPSGAVVEDQPVQDLPDHVRKMATIPIDSPAKFARVQGAE